MGLSVALHIISSCYKHDESADCLRIHGFLFCDPAPVEGIVRILAECVVVLHDDFQMVVPGAVNQIVE